MDTETQTVTADTTAQTPDAPALKIPKTCSVCGKLSAKNSKALAEVAPNHARFEAEGMGTKMRMLEKALGVMEEGAHKQKFNAQLQFYRDTLATARAEHDSFTPEASDTAKVKLVRTLVETLDLMGAKVEGEIPSVNALAEMVREHVAALVEKITAPAPGEAEAA